MRILVGLIVVCMSVSASASRGAKTNKAAARSHKKVVAKPEPKAEAKPDPKPEEKPAPPPETHRAPVAQVVDDEEPTARKKK